MKLYTYGFYKNQIVAWNYIPWNFYKNKTPVWNYETTHDFYRHQHTFIRLQFGWDSSFIFLVNFPAFWASISLKNYSSKNNRDGISEMNFNRNRRKVFIYREGHIAQKNSENYDFLTFLPDISIEVPVSASSLIFSFKSRNTS